jgi:hypothetical protein
MLKATLSAPAAMGFEVLLEMDLVTDNWRSF